MTDRDLVRNTRGVNVAEWVVIVCALLAAAVGFLPDARNATLATGQTYADYIRLTFGGAENGGDRGGDGAWSREPSAASSTVEGSSFRGALRGAGTFVGALAVGVVDGLVPNGWVSWAANRLGYEYDARGLGSLLGGSLGITPDPDDPAASWGTWAGELGGGLVGGKLGAISDIAYGLDGLSGADSWSAAGMALVQIGQGAADFATSGKASKALAVLEQSDDAVLRMIGRNADEVPTRAVGKVEVRAPGRSLYDPTRTAEVLDPSTPVYRVQLPDQELVLHDSPYFEPSDYALRGIGSNYEALYVSTDRAKLEDLRGRQRYFEQGGTMHSSTIGEVMDRAGPDAVLYQDTKFNGTVLGGEPGGYVVIRKKPRPDD